MKWDWSRPSSHDHQPLVEWWLEQLATLIVMRVAKRAHRRGDSQTFGRMLAIAEAGAAAERG